MGAPQPAIERSTFNVAVGNEELQSIPGTWIVSIKSGMKNEPPSKNFKNLDE